METADLHAICTDMKLRNHKKTNSRKALIEAIVSQADVIVPEPVQNRTITKKPTKRAIEKCTEYEELFQHYFLDQLVDWCKENGLKTSGTKKIIINRILAYFGGDKENTMADETRIRRSIKRRSAVPEDEDDDEEGENEEEEEEEEVKPKKGLSDRSKKPAPKKVEKKPVAKKTTKAPVEVEEEEEEEEEMTVDAERELRTHDEEVEDEEESDEVNQSSDNESQEEGISGVTFCLTGHMSTKREVIVKAIHKAGGKVVATVTKEVQVLVAEDPDAQSAKLDKARNDGVKVVGENYLKKFIEY
jgi:NAD-dependent DNA ligase